MLVGGWYFSLLMENIEAPIAHPKASLVLMCLLIKVLCKVDAANLVDRIVSLNHAFSGSKE